MEFNEIETVLKDKLLSVKAMSEAAMQFYIYIHCTNVEDIVYTQSNIDYYVHKRYVLTMMQLIVSLI